MEKFYFSYDFDWNYSLVPNDFNKDDTSFEDNIS